MIVNQ